MDLESESSARESVQDNEVTERSISHDADDKVKNNGSCANEIHGLTYFQNLNADSPPADKLEKGAETALSGNLGSPGATSPGVTSPPTTKGYGLKKWRRIRRDSVKDTTPTVDNSKILKRGLSVSSNNQSKPTHLPSIEIKQNSDGSVGSANLLKNTGVAGGFTIQGSSPDSRFAVGNAFSAATDSENSEDWSSKSSTAASAPKVRYNLPTASGYMRDKNRVKSLNGKSVGNSAQRVQQGKGRVETSKKPRGEKVKVEKENSHSSMESDSRSSNFVFMQGATSRTSNGKQCGRAMNYDGENNDEVHASEEQFNEEVQTAYRIDTGVEEFEDLFQDDLAADLSWEVKEEKSENNCPAMNQDPLMESILGLQSVQDALEKEIERFREIRMEPISLHDEAVKDCGASADSIFTVTQVHEPSSSDQLGAEKFGQNGSSSLEPQVLSLIENVKHLKSKLDAATVTLDLKEKRICELESSLNVSKSVKGESGSTIELQQEKCRDMESELEGLFQQKIETEIEYLALKRTIQTMRGATSNQIMLFEEQKTLAGEQAEIQSKLGEVENKAAELKKQAEELEKCCEDIFGTEEILITQRRIYKVTSCFSIQLILLLLVCWLFVSQLSPRSRVVVPT